LNLDAFVRLRPELRHLAAAGAWTGIVRHGLLSASALLDLHGVRGEARGALETRKRPAQHRLSHADGSAVLRDQRPLHEPTLAAQLTDGWAVRDWLLHLNRHAFLFPTERAALAFARVYADQENDLLVFDTGAVAQAAGERLRVSTVNAGAPAARAPTPRGPATLRPLSEHPATPGAVKEVAVLDGLPDVRACLLQVVRLAPGAPPVELWRRGEPLPAGALGP
jgi:hypothetical protein